MRTLVTGATGFVGANLVRRLLGDGHEVHCLVRDLESRWRIDDIRGDLHLHVADLADADGVTAAVVRVRPEWIFHLAAHGAYPTETDVRRMIAVNVTGTVNLVEAALQTGFAAFVHTGSSSEYGFKDHAPAETEWLEPNSDYAVTKAAATHHCRLTARRLDVPIVTLRLYSVFGPFEEPTRLLPTLVRRGLAGTLPPLVDPDVARDFVYVDDVVDACLLAATRPGQERGAVYNVGTGVQTTVRDVVDVARCVLGLAAEPVWGSMPDRAWDTWVWIADPTRIRAALGWHPRVGVEDGFRRLVAWYQMTAPASDATGRPGVPHGEPAVWS
jgi:dolichol-phosphate mannosyltransferase